MLSTPWRRLVIGGFLLIVGIVLVASTGSDQAAEEAFQAARLCTDAEASLALAASQDCLAVVPVTVTEGHRMVSRDTVLEGPAEFTVTSASGVRVSVNVSVTLQQFGAIHVGDTASIEVWRHTAVVFNDIGTRFTTDKFPVGKASLDRGAGPWLALAGAVITLTGILPLLTWMRSLWRSRGRRAPAPAPEPVRLSLAHTEFSSDAQRDQYAALMERAWGNLAETRTPQGRRPG